MDDMPNPEMPLAVMDGQCTLCTLGARLIARFDRRGQFRIATSQSALGAGLLRAQGLDPDDPESWLLLHRGRVWTGLDAMLVGGRLVGGLGWLLQPLWLLPPVLRRWLYRRIARNRYALFGRTDMCAVPDPKLRTRLLE